MRTMLILVCACLIATGEVIARQRLDNQEHQWVAPESAESMQNLLENRSEIAAGGMKLFHDRCRMCHGDEGTGTNHGPNLTLPLVQRQKDGPLFWKISGGNARTGMPGFSFLPRLQRWQLVNHVRTLGESRSTGAGGTPAVN
jgi:mono/diheme cytochrome c family protein